MEPELCVRASSGELQCSAQFVAGGGDSGAGGRACWVYCSGEGWVCTGVRRIKTFRSKTGRLYDGGPVRL